MHKARQSFGGSDFILHVIVALGGLAPCRPQVHQLEKEKARVKNSGGSPGSGTHNCPGSTMAGDDQERGSAGLDQTPAAIAPRATTLAMFLCNSNRGVLGWHAGAGAYEWPVSLTVSQARTECLCSLQPGVGTEHSCTSDTWEAWAWLPLDALPAPEPFLLYGYLAPLVGFHGKERQSQHSSLLKQPILT